MEYALADKKRRRKQWFALLLLLPALVFLLLIVVYPLVYSLSLSFHSFDLRKPHLGTPFVGIQNFTRAFQDPQFIQSLRITFLFMLLVIPIEFFFGLGIAMLLNRDLKGSKTIRTLVVVPMMVTPIIVGLQWRFLLNYDFGLVNQLLRLFGLSSGLNILGNRSVALLGVGLADIWQWTPFVVLLMYSGLRALPVEPYEAVRIDGATPWQTFKYLTIPLLKPVIVITVLLRSMDAFRIYDIIYSMTFGGPGTVTETASFYVYRMSFRTFQLGYAAALSYILLVITIIFATIFVRTLKKQWEG